MIKKNNIRVLQVINSLHTGGAEKLLIDTVPLYVQQGLKMDVLVLNGTKTQFWEALEKHNCCKIFSLGNGTVYNPFLIFKLVSYLKKYNIVHVHLFPAQYWVVLAKVISFSKTKLIFTEHSTSNRRIRNSFFGFLDTFFYKKYCKIVCITNDVFKIILNHSKVGKNKLVLIENGVNLKKIQLNEMLNKELTFGIKDKNAKLLIQVSSFQEPKDQKTFIHSLVYLPENVYVVLVGDGPLRQECEHLVSRLGLNKRVLFLGVRLDVPQLLKTADIVVLSSKYEGLSLASIEGMASGKPFVASDVPGLRDIVGGAGILFPLGDAQKLAEIINNLLNDINLYSITAKACMQRAQQYDIDTMVNKHINLYKQVVS
ncbi:glycosyltransferase [Lutibacter maritimus]|uniref:Glycosyltransferase involved in cell wall bisynthesis n=1 Tax=Lutibacter maritimus TaxID=593133 RepID=A0A1I6QML3_9FLAO|nr:glycosyltransferase [Lutibacter maritimus]SFS53640.1 Glycosyltransferase involved in cell wall bisynthesis [Lutibacter maritimus]